MKHSDAERIQQALHEVEQLRLDRESLAAREEAVLAVKAYQTSRFERTHHDLLQSPTYRTAESPWISRRPVGLSHPAVAV